jgi:hypothetical protein
MIFSETRFPLLGIMLQRASGLFAQAKELKALAVDRRFDHVSG